MHFVMQSFGIYEFPNGVDVDGLKESEANLVLHAVYPFSILY